jgi:hypothetical protein
VENTPTFITSALDKFIQDAIEDPENTKLEANASTNYKWIGYPFHIKVSGHFPQSAQVVNLLRRVGISHSYSENKIATDKFDLQFGHCLTFSDLYIIVYLMRNFGLQKVFYLSSTNSLLLGEAVSETTASGSFNTFIGIDEVLKTSFEENIHAFTNKYFSTKYVPYYPEHYGDERDKIPAGYSLNSSESDSDSAEEEDYRRDDFSAFTGGQLANYDDWNDAGGDMDYLREELGH